MDITLTFQDLQEEMNYGVYSHRIEFNLFKRLLYCMMIGSLSGSIYFVITGNYLYIALGLYMFLQSIIAKYLSRKSITYLNIVSFLYQIEIQTLLAVLITKLDQSLQIGTVMIITSAAFQLSMCLSIGTKCYLKILVNVYSTLIQIVLVNQNHSIELVWIGFSFFSLIFAVQFTYYQEFEKRQKYTLHQNTERIKENLINKIEIPILKCYNNENELKLEFVESNKCAQNLLKISNQETFIKFTREVVFLEGLTASNLIKQNSSLTFQNKQSLETLVHRFFKKQIFDDQIVKKTFQAYRCKVKHNGQEYLCQLILLYDIQPLCFIYLQKTYEDYITKLNEKMFTLNELVKRCVKESFSRVCEQQQNICKLYRMLKNNLNIVEKLDLDLYQMNIYFANCKILFNTPNFIYQKKKQNCIIKLIKTILFHFKHAVEKKHIKISLIYKEIDMNIICNEVLLKQLFYNIIENSIQFAKDLIEIKIIDQYDSVINQKIFTLSITNDIDIDFLETNNCHKNLKLGHLVAKKIIKEISPYTGLLISQMNHSYSVQFSLFQNF